jgi:hypothetical protein
MRTIALVLVLVMTGSACSVRAPAVAATHAASAKAPTGRLAGAPPALRAGVVEYTNVPAMRGEGAPADEHQHHHHP